MRAIPSSSFPLVVAAYGATAPDCLFCSGWAHGRSGFTLRRANLLTGKGPAPAQGFLAFWLAAWTLGGILAAYYVYRLFRPSIPESFKLKRNALAYDSGIPPFQMTYHRYGNQMEQWKSMFPKRTKAEIDKRQLETLRLRETDSGNRLTVDANATRLELGKGASEIEREWLYNVLAERYPAQNPQVRSA